MKTWIKATIVALLAIFSTSCIVEVDGGHPHDDYEYDETFYTFCGKSWSRIVESPGYYYFVCYDFHRDGSYTYWFYEDDRHSSTTYSIEEGRWEIHSYGWKEEIKLWGNWGSETYNVNDFLHGLRDDNSRRVIDDYKRIIDDLYYMH